MLIGGSGLMVTADDFGLSEKINRGILEAHNRGIVTSASLLIAGPAVTDALARARKFPRLKIGLHLAVVESPAVTALRNSLSAERDYFSGGPCLSPHWRDFSRNWFLGRIHREELWEELRAQCEAFLEHFPEIPFLNSTQHLHLWPGLHPLVARLCREYPIRRIRLFKSGRGLFSGRGVHALALRAASRRLATCLPDALVESAPSARGFERAGRLTKADLLRYLADDGPQEIMSHPGENDPALFDLYPGAFRGYQWSRERDALCDPEVRSAFLRRTSSIPGAIK